MNMGERIQQKRKEKNLTMQGLADLLNVGRSAVNKWEKGYVQNIKRTTIRDMAKIFDVNPAWLLCLTDDETPYESFTTPEEFELSWFRRGGGKHPIELSDIEHELVLSYRCADIGTKQSVHKLLDMNVTEKNEAAI